MKPTFLYALHDFIPLLCGILHLKKNRLVQPVDYSCSRLDKFASPIVVERYKIIFFIVPGVEEPTWNACSIGGWGMMIGQVGTQ